MKFKKEQKKKYYIPVEKEEPEYQSDEDVIDDTKPKKAMTSYQCFLATNTKVIQQETGLKHGEAVKKCREKWNGMSPEERDPYLALAQQDVQRYEKEMQEYNETGSFTKIGGTISTRGEPKKAKAKVIGASTTRGGKEYVKIMEEHALPKKVSVPFMYLVKEKSGQVIKEQGFKNCGPALKYLGTVWANMSEEEKQPYVDLSEQDAKR